jgi:hypothetical protein
MYFYKLQPSSNKPESIYPEIVTPEFQVLMGAEVS